MIGSWLLVRFEGSIQGPARFKTIGRIIIQTPTSPILVLLIGITLPHVLLELILPIHFHTRDLRPPTVDHPQSLQSVAFSTSPHGHRRGPTRILHRHPSQHDHDDRHRPITIPLPLLPRNPQICSLISVPSLAILLSPDPAAGGTRTL